MVNRQIPEAETLSSVEITSVTAGAAAEQSPEFVYADPHLGVLLFLLGFCLLYVLILAADRWAIPTETLPEDDTEQVSGRT